MANQYSSSNMPPTYYYYCGDNPAYQGRESPTRAFMDEYEQHRAHVSENPTAFANDIRFIMNALSAM
jgi:hypothetical protein